MWRHTRAWLLTDAGAGFVGPFASLGRPDISRLQLCPVCRDVANLQHFSRCLRSAASRGGPPPVQWPTVLDPAAADIEERIMLMGRCFMTVILQQP